MREKTAHTAVGAGTTAGNAWEEESSPVSRAAEAEDDNNLESLRTTGAKISGVPGAIVVQPVQPETAAPSRPRPGSADPGDEETVHSETTRRDLARNQAGIASRLE